MSLKSLAAIVAICTGFWMFACGQKHTEEELHKMAQDYETQGDLQKAISTYEEQIEDYPKGEFADEATEKIAFLYYNNLHDFNKAIEYHQNLIKNYPDSRFVAQARFMVGFIYANNLNDYTLAEQHYNEFLSKHPESELAASVKWELEHLGQDVNTQLDGIFGADNSNGGAFKK